MTEHKLTRKSALGVGGLAGAGLLVGGAFPRMAQAAPFVPFGAPQDYLDRWPSFPEPRVFLRSQAWWLEGPGDVTVSIADAMKASHIHYEAAFPFMEPWADTGDSYEYVLPVKIQLHNFVGGRANNVGGLGFEDGGAVKVTLNWAPTAQDETRYAVLKRLASSVKVCGRRETRGHVNCISPNGGEEFFNSFGWQSLVPCRAGRTKGDQRGPTIIFRSWYEQANYDNVNFNDESGHSETGFRASTMGDPIPSSWTVKGGLASGANRWVAAIDPDIHAGTYSRVGKVWRGTGTAWSVTVNRADLAPGIHTLMVAGAANIGVSATNPKGGQNVGVGVIPFRVGT